MKSLSVSQIQQTVCDYYHIPVDATQTKSRKRELVQARQVTMHFSRKKTKESLSQVGLEVAARDHATVLHACKTVKNLIDTDKSFKYDIYLIERELIKLERRILDEPETRDFEVADLHDFFPHPGSYPEIEFTTVKLFRPKLWAMKFKVFKTKVVNISNNIFKPVLPNNSMSRQFVSPYAGVLSYNNREMHGWREHAL